MATKPRQLRSLELRYIAVVRLVRGILFIVCALWLIHGSWPADTHGRYLFIGVAIAISEPLRNLARVKCAQSLNMGVSHSSTTPSPQVDEFMEYRLSERLFRATAVVPAWPASLLLSLLFDVERDKLEFTWVTHETSTRM